MRKLGISIYPEKTEKDRLLKYIDKASECGFSRIFSCLISASGEKEEIKKIFREINLYGKSKGFEIILDVNPKVFKELGISYDDLSFFKEAGADGIVMAEPLAGLLSPALAEEFSAPYVKRIVEALQTDDFLVIYHNCGNSTIQMIDSNQTITARKIPVSASQNKLSDIVVINPRNDSQNRIPAIQI